MSFKKRSVTTARESKRLARKKQAINTAMQKGTPLGLQFSPLSQEDLIKIHRAAPELLAKTGVAGATPKVKELASRHGCEINALDRILFPPALIEDLIDKAAKSFPVYGRSEAFDWEARNGTVNFCTGGAAVSMLDLDSQKYRPSTLSDLYDLARLCDTLENIQWFARPVVATDIEDLYDLDINTVYACLRGTQKHIATSFSKGEHVYRIEPLLDLACQASSRFRDRPFCTVHATNIVSPLTFASDSLDVTCAAVDIGMPVHSQTGPQSGATAPAALAGTLVQGVAESLASLAVINMLKPGHPVIIGNWVFVSDLRTGAFSGGGAEQALLGAASGQLSAFYGIPGGMGAGMTDSKLPDNQSGFEKGLTMLAAGLSGGGLVFESAGMLGSLLGCSHEAMVIDNEMLSSIHRIARGIEVNDETLSVEVISDAVNGPGHYLGHPQTMELMQTEFIYPDLADRAAPSDWESLGGHDIFKVAHQKAKQILNDHRPQYIDEKSDQAIRSQFPIKLGI